PDERLPLLRIRDMLGFVPALLGRQRDDLLVEVAVAEAVGKQASDVLSAGSGGPRDTDDPRRHRRDATTSPNSRCRRPTDVLDSRARGGGREVVVTPLQKPLPAYFTAPDPSPPPPTGPSPDPGCSPSPRPSPPSP